MPQYPRQVMKRIMRQSDPQMRVSGNADVLAYVDYVSFIRELAAEASSAAEAAGSREIDVHHVEAALERVQARFRG